MVRCWARVMVATVDREWESWGATWRVHMWVWLWIFCDITMPIVWCSPAIDQEKQKMLEFLPLSLWEKDRQMRKEWAWGLQLKLSLHVGVTGSWVALMLASQNYNKGQKSKTKLSCLSHISKGASNTHCQLMRSLPLFLSATSTTRTS